MKDQYLYNLILKYKNKGLIIDSNLLLLLFIGSYNLKLISKFKRTEKYSEEDFIFINKFASYFKRLLTTPNILTEVCNLSNQLPEEIRKDFLGQFTERVILFEESYYNSSEASKASFFEHLGLTDSLIIILGKKECLVLTDDFRLSNYLNSNNVDVINFNHIRTSWLLEQ